MKAEYGDAATTIDPTCANVVAEAFPRTFGQPLVSFLADDKPVDERRPTRSSSGRHESDYVCRPKIACGLI